MSTAAALWLVGGGLALACVALYLLDPPTRSAPSAPPAGGTALSSSPVGRTARSSERDGEARSLPAVPAWLVAEVAALLDRGRRG